MRILALETTEKEGTVAVADGDKLLLELKLCSRHRSAQSLAPAIQNLLEQVGLESDEVGLVAVSVGPGSFTGLRVGVTTAKVFAYAIKAEILAVSTLECIAAAAKGETPELAAVIDAQRGYLAEQRFVRHPDGGLRPMGVERLVDVESWLAELPPGMAVSGPGLAQLVDRLPGHVAVVDPSAWPPRAAVVAQLAARDYAAGRRDDLWQLVPHYSRRPAAEERLEERLAASALMIEVPE
jgi:tRNA threonylcarbamoyladenosine biosynthesis protein TsaB